MTIYTYSGLVSFACFLLGPLLRRIPLGAKWNVTERCGPGPGSGAPGPTVWLHGASLGEAQLMLRLLPTLTNRYPDHAFALSATTAGGVDRLRMHRCEKVVWCGFLPFDTIGRMKRMLEQFHVRRVWLLETEIWPSLLWVCRKNGVPVGILNARMERRSFARYRRFSGVMAPFFSHLRPVVAQNSTYAERFARSGVAPAAITIGGNLKIDRSIRPVERDARTVVRREMGIAPEEVVIAAGCLHPGEGGVIDEALACLRGRGFSCRCIIVPRHIKRAGDICAEFSGAPQCIDKPATGTDWRVCCIAAYGVLDDVYRMADAAVIGGTFVPVGGHNPWDAARYGIPTVFGPHYETQQIGCRELMRARIGFCVHERGELGNVLAGLLGSGSKKIQRAVTAYIRRTTISSPSWEEALQ